MLHFAERLRRFKELHHLKDAPLGRMLGISGQHVGQIIRGEKSHSRPLEILLDRLEREDERDPFLIACEEILDSENDRVVQAFTVNVYSVLRNLNEKEAVRLEDVQPIYLKKRKANRRAHEAG